jgi:alcohol dehydrogenase class IV
MEAGSMSFIQLPGKMYFGSGASGEVAARLAKQEIKTALLFTDKTLRKLGVTSAFEKSLTDAGIALSIVDDIAAEPSVQDVETALAAAPGSVNSGNGAIIACGGGSVMDTAKLASVLLRQKEYSLRDLLKNPTQAKKQIKSIMLPTTCGTGSEATCNAIVAIPEQETKQGIVNNEMISDEVVLDPAFLAKLPKSIVAATGVDALAHCVECFTSKKATPLSDTYALAGARLIFHNIEKAYNDPDDIEAKSAMLLGSFYGGAAITGSGTTAVHALAYPLGGKYHIAHGVSNAILFAIVMRFNNEGASGAAFSKRLAALCDAVYPEQSGLTASAKADFIISRISGIVKNTNIPVSVKEFGVKESDLETLVTLGSAQTRLLVNNMKELSADDIRSMYQKVL